MAKTISIQVQAGAGFDKALVKIVAQTNRNANFGDNGSNTFVASNGISLISNEFPARDKDRSLPAAKKIYVRGSNFGKDDNSFDISQKKLPALEQAVREYNAYFTDAAIYKRAEAAAAAKARAARPAGARPAADGCSYIIG